MLPVVRTGGKELDRNVAPTFAADEEFSTFDAAQARNNPPSPAA